MKIFELDREYEFNLLPPTVSIDFVRLKFIKLLNMFDFSTDHDSDEIKFKKKIKFYGDKRFGLLSFLQDGTVKIYSEGYNLKILWKVRLEKLYFLTILYDLIVVLFAWHFFDFQVLSLILIAICGFALIWFIGTTEIIYKINEINAICLDE